VKLAGTFGEDGLGDLDVAGVDRNGIRI